MRKVIALEFLTLDGVMQAPGGPDEDKASGFKYGGWQFPYFSDEDGKLMAKQMAGKYDLLLGRKTYDIFASYWPTHAGDFWPQVNRITKYVVSKTLKNPSWENTVILRNTADVKKIKKEKGPALQIYGSGNLVQSLLKENLVDELWLKVHPLILGEGKKLLEEGIIPTTFELTESHVTPSGVIFANYKRTGNKIKTGTF